MNGFLILFLMILGTKVSYATEHFKLEAEENGAPLLSPAEEESYLKSQHKEDKKRFPQTKWLECNDTVTGNYTGFNCTNKRGISVILNDYLQENFLRCANEGLSTIGFQKAVNMHITHNGIQGGTNHQSKSLHTEARAIDVKSFTMYFSSGKSRDLFFKSSKNTNFFNAFRSCWGRTIANQNGCPLILRQTKLTASIGKEDSNHQDHIHVSIPHCVNGKYSNLYFRR